jgi:multidrug resistance efflux pump
MSQRGRFFVLLGILTLGAAIYYFATTNRSSDLVLVGTVDANQVIVSPKIEGRIEKLLVDEGTEVKAGDLIAILDSAELEAQKAAAAATLNGMGSRVSQFKATELSTRGETSYGVSNAEARLQAAHSSLAEAQATLTKLKLDRDRIVQLAEQGVASKQDRDRAQADYDAQVAHVKSMQDQTRAAEADLETARAHTEQANAARSTVAASRADQANARAQLAQIDTRLGYTRVVAPISGTVSVRVAREGEVVNIGSPIVTIVDLTDTWVRASVPEDKAVNIGIGDTLRVRLPNAQIVKGRVITKSPEGDFATQRDVSRLKRDIKTVGLKLAIDNPRKQFVPGMTADVLISPDEIDGKAGKERAEK